MLILCFLSFSLQALENKRVFKVLSFMGFCEYRLSGDEWKVLNAGEAVYEDSEVRVNGKDDYLELELEDSLRIKLIGPTTLHIKEILRYDFSGNKSTLLSLNSGKIFARFKNISKRIFKIETETAVVTVKGTRFFISFFPEEGGELIVTEGVVEVDAPLNLFKPFKVREGQMFKIPASATESILPVMQASRELIVQYDKEYREISNISPQKPEKSQPESKSNLPSLPSLTAVFPFFLELGENAGKILNFSLGTQKIGKNIYGMFVFTPALNLGNISLALYLPFYFLKDDNVFSNTNHLLYNTNDWNFSSLDDVIADIVSKIYSLEFRSMVFSFKIGTITDYTLGNGLFINGYANDIFYPFQRIVGGVVKVDTPPAGLEGFVNNIASFEVIGARAYIRPLFFLPVIGKWSVGISSFLDRKPSNSSNSVFGYSLDFDFPFLDFGFLGLGFFGGIGGMGYSTNLLTGLGLNCGVKGNVFMVFYKLEYKNSFGGFLPDYVNKTYEVDRAKKFEVVSSFSQTSFLNDIYNLNNIYHGVESEVGFNFTDIARFGISYTHFFKFGENQKNTLFNSMHIEATLYKSFIKKVYFTVSYDRNNFSLDDLFFNFTGGGSLITFEVFYQLVDRLYLGVNYRKFFEGTSGSEVNEKDLYGLRMEVSF